VQLLEALLAPERLALAAEAAADEKWVQRAWPPEAAQRPFIEYLRSQYDATQLRAIEVEKQKQKKKRKANTVCTIQQEQDQGAASSQSTPRSCTHQGDVPAAVPFTVNVLVSRFVCRPLHSC